MKSFIVLSVLMAVASAQFLRDTPEVTAAKQQFAAAYNAAARAAATASPYAAPTQQQVVEDDGSQYPAAVPYIHEEIPAEPYVHVEVPAEPYVHIEPARNRKPQPAQLAQPAQLPNFVYNNQPAQPVQYAQQPGNGCYNWKGEAVQCRTDFSANLV